MSSRSETFTQALSTLDSDSDPASLVGLFAADAELLRPELHADGSHDATAFWDTYRAQFGDIATTFTRTQEDGDLGVLEWTSSGSLAAGRPVEYAGVSLLSFGDDGLITRFATYYDTAAFLVPGPDHE